MPEEPPSPSTPSTFPLFPRLPGELRNAIWEEALRPQAQKTPTLVPYPLGLWYVDYNRPSIKLDGNSFDVHISVPLAHVNREARSLALSWAQTHGLIVNKGGYPVFARSFDHSIDAVVINLGQHKEMQQELRDLSKQSGAQSVETRTAFKNIAIVEDEATITHEYWQLGNFLLWLGMRKLLIVRGTLTEGVDKKTNPQGQRTFVHSTYHTPPNPGVWALMYAFQMGGYDVMAV